MRALSNFAVLFLVAATALLAVSIATAGAEPRSIEVTNDTEAVVTFQWTRFPVNGGENSWLKLTTLQPKQTGRIDVVVNAQQIGVRALHSDGTKTTVHLDIVHPADNKEHTRPYYQWTYKPN